MAHYSFDIKEINNYLDILKFGDTVSLSGYIYTARDAAHKRLVEGLSNGDKLPFDNDFAIYYAGPTPSREGQIIGSCGPTTSSRMDVFSETMMENGMKCMIGKGKRADYVVDAMKKQKCVYLVAVGGAGAVISDSVKQLDVVCYHELGCESVKKLYVENFPAIVATDVTGGTLYK